MTAPEPATGSKPATDSMKDPQLARWERFRNSRNTALASAYGWLTLTSFQWLEDRPAGVELAPGLWSTDGTAAFLTAAAPDGLTLVETGEPVDGTISAVLADEESLMWVQYGGGDGRQVVVELAMRAGKYAIRTRDSQSPVFTGFDGVPTFDFRPDLVLYQSGVDALDEDRLGRLAMTHAGLVARDELVLNRCHRAGTPVALALGGGYAEPIEASVRAYVNTYRVAKSVYGF